MNILIAGGAGYIGSHTVQELVLEGFDVTVFDNFSTGKRELLPDSRVFEGDLMDKDSIEEAFDKSKFDAVLHFASLIEVGESYVNPNKYYTHNLFSSLNLLDVMLKKGVKKFIFSSSAAVYGDPETSPISEDHPLHPINPYGQTKYFVEKILEDYDRAHGLKFVSLRYFNAAGADPEGQRGEVHNPETHLIPNILLFLLNKKDRFFFYGSDFPTPDGSAIRDYIHVKDLARAHVLALKKLFTRPKSEFINLGTNSGNSVLEIITKVEQVTGKTVRYTTSPRRLGDPPVLLASKDKAERLLDWSPEYSDIETIIRTAWNWHSKH
ncbi:MAG: UDP-glucose 4-epimerase GalE [Candidatus Aminicenantes bacterium]|nr:UDP-glucose 4-epimerase GalE [Candidatus Aminicenantes bacterium]